MLNKFKTLSLAAVVVVAGAVSAGAAVFDFAALANSPTAGEGDWGDIVGAGGWTQGGITVYAGAANAGADAYLDKNFAGRDAGLGVCQYSVGTPGQCSPSNDDNVQFGETLILSFSKVVRITNIVLRDANHYLYSLGDAINFSGASGSGLYTVGPTGVALSNVFGNGTSWNFTTAFSGQFYISSISVAAVPVPAAGLMMLTGLGGIFAFRRRRKA